MIQGKYVKRPTPIEVVEATCSDDLSKTTIRWHKTKINGGEVYNELHDSWIKFSFGDVLNITDDTDVYPIERKVFEKTYEKV